MQYYIDITHKYPLKRRVNFLPIEPITFLKNIPIKALNCNYLLPGITLLFGINY